MARPVRISVPLAPRHSPRTLIWLRRCQETINFRFVFFHRLAPSKAAGGEARVGGDVSYPAGWYADIRELPGCWQPGRFASF